MRPSSRSVVRLRLSAALTMISPLLLSPCAVLAAPAATSTSPDAADGPIDDAVDENAAPASGAQSGEDTPSAPNTAPVAASNGATDVSASNTTTTPLATSGSVLVVAVEMTGFELDSSLVLAAISKELGVATAAAPAGSSAQLRVSATKGGDLVVSFTPKDGVPLLRAVDAPQRDDEVPEACALLAGNLARDQASELLASLNPPVPAEPAGAAEPEPQAPPAVASDPTADSGPKYTQRVANLTLAYPLTIVPDTESAELHAELGLFYSRIGQLRGAGLNPLVLQIDGESQSVSTAGLVGIYGGAAMGVHFGGLVNLHGDAFTGVSVAGLGTVGSGPELGVNVAGVFTFNVFPTVGARVAGLVNVSDDVMGFQVAGLGNLSHDTIGPQIAGFGNYSRNTGGPQVAGAVNIAKSLDGFQLSGFANISRERTHGAQIGVFNYGGDVRGLQLGVVNVADDVQGASIGLVTYSKKGKVQPVAWYSSFSPVNLGVRFYTGPLYAMPTFGYDKAVDPASDSEQKVDAVSLGLSLGARIPIRRAFIDIDGNYSNPLRESHFDEHDVNLRYRALVGFSVTDWFGVFAGGGVLHQFRTKDYQGTSFKPEFSAGIELL